MAISRFLLNILLLASILSASLLPALILASSEQAECERKAATNYQKCLLKTASAMVRGMIAGALGGAAIGSLTGLAGLAAGSGIGGLTGSAAAGTGALECAIEYHFALRECMKLNSGL